LGRGALSFFGMISTRSVRVASLVALLLFSGLAGCVTNNMTSADYNRMYQNQWGNYRGG
jgi:hypothetical protein